MLSATNPPSTNQQVPGVVSTAEHLIGFHSAFNTIQGEGPNAGRAATFIRLSGCNLQCRFCDTEYTSGSQTTQVDSVVKDIAINLGGLAKHVVITGGEPFRQPKALLKVVRELLENGHTIDIETNGTLRFGKGMVDLVLDHDELTIICAPKSPMIGGDALVYSTACKLLINAEAQDDDGWPTEILGGQHLGIRKARPFDIRVKEAFIKLADKGMAFVHPEDVALEAGQYVSAKNDANMKAAAEFVIANPAFKLGVQLHKVYGLE